jgi:formate hydrogenlyase subunit 3/multisubunit Na+/H+ antiporter MnhD subunit
MTADLPEINVQMRDTCQVLLYLCAFYLSVLLFLSLLIIRRNGLRNKSVASILFFLIVMLSIKLWFFVEEYKAYKSGTVFKQDGLLGTMLTALPVLFFMMASILNLNYWINFFLSADKTICEFDGRPFDKKLYYKRKDTLYYITGSLIAVIIGYIVILGAYPGFFNPNT